MVAEIHLISGWPRIVNGGLMSENEHKLAEYKEATQLHRHESILMFGELTVYLGVMAATFKPMIDPTPPPTFAQLAIGFAGLVLTLVFWVIHRRTGKHQTDAVKRAKELERELGFNLYCQRKFSYVSVRVTTYAIHVMGLVGSVVVFVSALMRIDWPSLLRL